MYKELLELEWRCDVAKTEMSHFSSLSQLKSEESVSSSESLKILRHSWVAGWGDKQCKQEGDESSQSLSSESLKILWGVGPGRWGEANRSEMPDRAP